MSGAFICEHEGPGTAQGYLTKKGRLRKSWKKRFFVLTRTGRFNYYSESLKLGILVDRKKKGELFLRPDTTTVRSIPGKDLDFCVQTPTRILHLRAESLKEKEAWISCLRFHTNPEEEHESEDIFRSSIDNLPPR